VEACAWIGSQLFAVAMFDDAAFIQNENVTGAVKRAQAMGDDDGGAVE